MIRLPLETKFETVETALSPSFWGFVKTSNAPMALRGQIHQEFYFIIASPVILERELWLSSLLNRKADSNYLSC